MMPSPTPPVPHPLAYLWPLPAIAGLLAWLFTTDWRWAIAGLAGVLLVACVNGAVQAREARR